MPNIPEWATHPVTAASGAVASLTALASPETLYLVGEAVLLSAPQIFTGVTLGTLTLPNFLPPSSTADWIGVGAGVLMGVYLLYQVNANFDDKGL